MIEELKDLESDIKTYMNTVYDLNSELSDVKAAAQKTYKKLLLDIIELADSFEMRQKAFHREEEDLNPETIKWIKKYRIIYKKLKRILDKQNVAEIEIMAGEIVNPSWHNPIETISIPGKKENSIHEVHQKGYLLKGKLLRDATVTIIKNK
jgi:molecular chaperone GrpE